MALYSLNMSGKCNEEIGSKLIGVGVEKNCCRQELDLSWNRIRGGGATALMKAVKVHNWNISQPTFTTSNDMYAVIGHRCTSSMLWDYKYRFSYCL